MSKGRMEAFSDGVLAVIITIMVLEMKSPRGMTLAALAPVLPVFLSYVLSFVYLGIYWNNHHHLLHATQRVRKSEKPDCSCQEEEGAGRDRKNRKGIEGESHPLFASD